MTTVIEVAQVAAKMRVLGWGTRRGGVWTSRCDIGCEGCASRHMWGASGHFVAVNSIIDWLKRKGATDGLTLSGGEPTLQAKNVLFMINSYREEFGTGADVLLFSGLTYPKLLRNHPQLLAACDIVCAGPYVHQLPALPLRGSSNQTLHLQSELARERYRDVDQWPVHQTQVTFVGQRIVTVGIPNTDSLAIALDADRFDLAGASWQRPSA